MDRVNDIVNGDIFLCWSFVVVYRLDLRWFIVVRVFVIVFIVIVVVFNGF